MATALQLNPAAPLTDEQVIGQVLQGRAELFELLMRRHNERLYRAVRAVLRDEGQVEDVMQETYLRAYAHLADFHGHSTFATWLVRIGVHEALWRARRASIAPVPTDVERLETPASGETPERQAEHRQLIEMLEHAVDALPVGYREVFVLRSVDGFSVAETAEVLGLTEEAVKMRAFRAHAKLRSALDRVLEGSANELFSFAAPRCNRVVAAVMARLPG